uniref:BPTI/Kunitz inhibitor domain-containing protein n=1 Tax=Amblyomma tuberculatum TaxID=48802 RepID=A0A6M2E5H8_9ACAR
MKLLILPVLVFLMGMTSAGNARLSEGRTTEICRLRLPRHDTCKAAKPGYRYNTKKMRCEWYTWGCGKNANHFATREECYQRCGKHLGVDPCTLAKDEGQECRQTPSHKNYWFDHGSQSCRLFVYRGCGGNGNNFLYASECWELCRFYVRDPCKFPISTGHHCPNDTTFMTQKIVFGYNKATHQCERFTYSGCGGYDNRFGTAKECWTNCAGLSGSKCILESSAGSRLGFTRFYYNMSSNTCEKSRYLTYGTSGKNRFLTLNDCEKKCKANHTYVKDDV